MARFVAPPPQAPTGSRMAGRILQGFQTGFNISQARSARATQERLASARLARERARVAEARQSRELQKRRIGFEEKRLGFEERRVRAIEDRAKRTTSDPLFKAFLSQASKPRTVESSVGPFGPIAKETGGVGIAQFAANLSGGDAEIESRIRQKLAAGFSQLLGAESLPKPAPVAGFPSVSPEFLQSLAVSGEEAIRINQQIARENNPSAQTTPLFPVTPQGTSGTFLLGPPQPR